MTNEVATQKYSEKRKDNTMEYRAELSGSELLNLIDYLSTGLNMADENSNRAFRVSDVELIAEGRYSTTLHGPIKDDFPNRMEKALQHILTGGSYATRS